MDSGPACHEFEPSTAEDPPCRGIRGTLNMSRFKRPPVGMVWKFLKGVLAQSRKVGGRERVVVCPDSTQVVPQNWGGTEINRTVTCSVLKVTANDMRQSSLLP
ncbi:hypothetical protein TNCV_223741 [Trichonephila clavipes]|nr:hypothetical protein TNCV_223741 [Trichonephila clavipes]